MVGPLEQIREKIAGLEFNPVKVGEFLAYTDNILEGLVVDLKKKNF